MTDNEVESGLELEFDTRKLIVVFVVAIAICGLFFVWGFVVGKRQGMHLESAGTAATVSEARLEASPGPGGAGNAEPDSPALDSETVQEDLDWYKSVNRKAGEPEKVQPARSQDAENPPEAKTQPAPEVEEPAAAKASVTPPAA